MTRTPGSRVKGLFAGRPVGKQRTRRFMLTIGGLGVAVLLVMGALTFNVANSVPGRSYFDIKGQFDEADNLANHYEVRIGGLRAGQVLKPRVEDGKALVDIRLDEEFGELMTTDTTMRVRLRSAVGVRYLELTPGTEGQPLQEGDTLPAENVERNVALDEVLGTFDPETRDRTQKWLADMGGGFAGNGTNLNVALGSAPQFFEKLGSVSSAITSRPGAMRQLIRGTDGLLSTFDAVRNEIAEGFDNQANAARAFADTRDDFHATLDQAPPTLATARSALPAVSALVREVDGLATQGKPTLDLAPVALTQTNRFLRDSQPALNNADRTLDLLREASPPTLQFLQRLQPEMPDVLDLVSSLRPPVREISRRHDCDFSNLFSGWGRVLKWGDSYSNQIRFDVTAAPSTGQLAGTTDQTIPDGKGGSVLDRFSDQVAYPEACNAKGEGEGQGGREKLSVEEDARGFTYSNSQQPTEYPSGSTP